MKFLMPGHFYVLYSSFSLNVSHILLLLDVVNPIHVAAFLCPDLPVWFSVLQVRSGAGEAVRSGHAVCSPQDSR